ncbi:polysaccharide biosynthesis tyrosine autokinase [Pseudomonadota bacterium]
MKIKALMNFLNKESSESDPAHETCTSDSDFGSTEDEKVIYIDNTRPEATDGPFAETEILARGTGWTDQSLGELLVAQGKLSVADVDRVIDNQRNKGLYFGEAAVDLKLVTSDDILRALSRQFGYTYGQDDEVESFSEMVMAGSPFGEQAEEFRSIRAQLLNNWLSPDQKTLAIVSPGSREGRSYIAANLAQAFSQLGRSTLLIDADLRSPRQHVIFNFTGRIGLSMLLAGRISIKDLSMLPDKIQSFQHLSVLACGAVPPNPSELLNNGRFHQILFALKKYFDVIIIDTPPAACRSDLISIASIAGSALLVARSGHSKIEDAKSLMSTLRRANVNIVGGVLNQY